MSKRFTSFYGSVIVPTKTKFIPLNRLSAIFVVFGIMRIALELDLLEYSQ